MGFELLCMGLIALLLGFVIAFYGYRLFLVLLPIWGFVFGFTLAAQTIELLFGSGFLSTITSWVVGAVVGIVFGLLAYLFWLAGVALFSASFGYVLGTSLMAWIGVEEPWLIWLVGLAAAALAAVIVIRWNLQKYAIILITGTTGAAMMVVGLLLPFGVFSLDSFTRAVPISSLISSSPMAAVFWLLFAVVGVVIQWRINQNYQLETGNFTW